MTITISDELETRLHEEATRQGRQPDAVAERFLAPALDAAEQEREESVKAIQEGLDDFAAGRYGDFAETAAKLRAKYNLPTHLTDEGIVQVEAQDR